MKKIYLDYASTTPISSLVIKKMSQYFSIDYGNSSSIHTFGRNSKTVLKNSREKIAKIINCNKKEIIFTGSGTESDNLAIIGIAHAYKSYGKHIIVSKIEHKAVLEAVKKLEKEGFEITYLDVDKNGIIKINEFKKVLRKDTILVSIMYANNEIGTIEPIEKISQIISKHRENNNVVFFHTDACQAVGSLPIDVKKLGVDFMTFNGSKIYGPKGIGCLYKRQEANIEPQIVGGGQERNLRSGTENIPSIAGFAEALIDAEKKRLKESQRLTSLRNYCIKELTKNIPKSYINGHLTERLPNNINVSFWGVEGEAMVLMLDKFGIFCSTGSACASSDLVPSHVLLAIGCSPELAHGSIRLALGKKTTLSDIKYTVKIITKVVKELRAISSIKI